ARPRLKPGDEILVTWLEHHSNIVPWQLIAQITGGKLHVVPIDEDGDLTLEELERHLSARTKIVSVTHISNALGTILPVRELVELAHDRGIPVIVDGAQSAAHTPVDVQDIGRDFFAFSSHKMYGPTGSGAPYRQPRRPRAEPPRPGGRAHD